MRYFGKPKAEVSRARRRCHLAILIAATGVTLSTHAIAGDELAPVAGITGNPFCDQALALDQPVQLASEGAVRLVPIGRAIGLQPISQTTELSKAKGVDNARFQNSRPQSPAITIDPVNPPAVRSNPLANAKTTSSASPKPLDVVRSSRLTFIPSVSQGVGNTIHQTSAGNEDAHVVSANPNKSLSPNIVQGQVAREAQKPNLGTKSAPIQKDLAPSVPSGTVSQEGSVHTSAVTIAAVPQDRPSAGTVNNSAAQDPANPIVVQEDDPVMFSLSDDEEAVSANLLEALTENEPDDVTVAEVSPDDNTVEWSLSDELEESTSEPIVGVEPVIIDPAPPVDFGDTEPSKPNKSNGSLVEDPANEILRRDRYRPPVEVQSVPVAIERLADVEAENSSVTLVEDVIADIMRSINDPKKDKLADVDSPKNDVPEVDPNSTNDDADATKNNVTEPELAQLPAPAKLELPEGMKAIPLRLNFAQVRSLTIGGSLKDIRIMDQSICQAVATSSNQIKLIGTGNGVTQLVVWAEVDDATKPTRVQAFEIIVDSHEKSGAADDSMSMLDKSIKQTFPTSEVTLDALGDRVRVSGKCSDDATAKKILRMVRRTCSIPVEDHLEVRRR